MPSAPIQPDWPKVWRCPACRYEMTGAPGPICPECGIDAVAEHERRRTRGVGVRRRVSPDWLLAVAVTYALLFALVIWTDRVDNWEASDLAFYVFGFLTLRWLWAIRHRTLSHTLNWRLGVTAVIGMYAAWISSEGYWTYSIWHYSGVDLDQVIREAVVVAGVLVAAWLLTPRRSLATLVLLLGLLTLAHGVTLTSLCEVHLSLNDEWSIFTDPRPGQIYDQYPLRWDEVRLLGPVVLCAGAAITLAGLSLRRRTILASINRLSSPPPSHAPCPPATSPPPPPPS